MVLHVPGFNVTPQLSVSKPSYCSTHMGVLVNENDSNSDMLFSTIWRVIFVVANCVPNHPSSFVLIAPGKGRGLSDPSQTLSFYWSNVSSSLICSRAVVGLLICNHAFVVLLETTVSYLTMCMKKSILKQSTKESLLLLSSCGFKGVFSHLRAQMRPRMSDISLSLGDFPATPPWTSCCQPATIVIMQPFHNFFWCGEELVHGRLSDSTVWTSLRLSSLKNESFFPRRRC